MSKEHTGTADAWVTCATCKLELPITGPWDSTCGDEEGGVVAVDGHVCGLETAAPETKAALWLGGRGTGWRRLPGQLDQDAFDPYTLGGPFVALGEHLQAAGLLGPFTGPR